MSTNSESEKPPKPPKTPCPPGLKPTMPSHDAFMKDISNNKKGIWSYNFNITNVKILDNAELGKINNDDIKKIITNSFKTLEKII